MAHLHDIVVDCRHPASVARFWAAALDGYRVHLDIQADDPAAEIQRLIGLGARVLAEHDDFTVLADLEDNEFCLSARHPS